MAEEVQKRRITIKIDLIKLPIIIDAGQEELYRKAEKALNQRVREFVNTVKHTNETIAITAIAYELMFEKLTSEAEKEDLEQEIEKYISSEEKP